jgi:Sulfotransferase family
MDIDVLRERLMNEGVSWRALFASMLQVYADSQGKPYSGEKTPEHALYVKMLCDWFPDCTIIHLVRNPRAAVYSLTQVPWASRSVLMGARTWRLFNTAARGGTASPNVRPYRPRIPAGDAGAESGRI